MTMQETADEINKLFRDYGLDHDVVRIRHASYADELAFIRAHDSDAMELLLSTIRYVFDVYFVANPPSAQMRLF